MGAARLSLETPGHGAQTFSIVGRGGGSPPVIGTSVESAGQASRTTVHKITEDRQGERRQPQVP
jgi:hypothetical protein